MNLQQALYIAQSNSIYADYTQETVDRLLDKAVWYDKMAKKVTSYETKRLSELSAEKALYIAEAIQYIVNNDAL